MRNFLLTALLVGCHGFAGASDVSIGVLGLFHPQTVIVKPQTPDGMICSSSGQQWPLREAEQINLQGDMLTVSIAGQVQRFSEMGCSSVSSSGPAHFYLSLPGKISRSYEGDLVIRVASGNTQRREMQLIVTMGMETAVASIVAAENTANTPLEALKAQAVAARSFLAAGKGRHRNFDYCDTTHCQFLRQPPRSNSPAQLAADQTKGLVLAYQDKVFAAMYSSSCSGKTHTLGDLGIPVHDYPYYSVVCDYCHRHPHQWSSTISAKDAATLHPGENGRLQLARQLGWKTVLSNSYTAHAADGSVVLEGVGVGHGLGLCQKGAADMARHGASWEQVLQHYYPNTTLKNLR